MNQDVFSMTVRKLVNKRDLQVSNNDIYKALLYSLRECGKREKDNFANIVYLAVSKLLSRDETCIVPFSLCDEDIEIIETMFKLSCM